MSEVIRSSSSLVRTNKKKSPKSKSSNKSIRLNWKFALNFSYAVDSIQEINRDRLWSEFINTQRKLCPETNWLSLYTVGKVELDPKLISKTQTWLESMVASSAWPFPKQVIIKTNHHHATHIQILIENNNSFLPFVEMPDGMIAIKLKTKHHSGWEVRLEETLSQTKAGNA